MVDRVYKASLPRMRQELERLREGFSQVEPRTDWGRLRVEPLLAHVRSLERLLGSRDFSREGARLSKGVVMFHADLVYLRTNLQALKQLLESERAARARSRKG